MKNIKLLLVILCLPIFSYSITKINGYTAKGFKGKEVNLIEYQDFITKKYRILKTVKVDTSGRFNFDLNIHKTQEALIQIDYLIGIIYLDANQEYTIFFPPYSENGEYKLTRNYTNIVFKTIPKDDINRLILRFNVMYDQFLEVYLKKSNHGYLGNATYHKKLDEFKKKVFAEFKEIKNTYFSAYVKANLGELELIAKSQTNNISKLNVYNTFIINKKIHFDNAAQISFIKKFYEKSFMDPGKIFYEIESAINKDASLVKLEMALSKDYFFKVKKVRQLAIVDNLYTLFYNKEYSQKNILKILNELTKKSPTTEIRTIAKNVISELLKNKKGTKATGFKLVSSKDEPVSLSDFRGKYVYLNFWAVWNKDSQKEMSLYPDFIKKYGDNIEFVSINVDSKKSKFDMFIATHPSYKWTQLYYGGNSNLLDAYGVVSLPKYILLDPKGNIVEFPANRPTPNGDYISIDKTFYSIQKKNTKKNDFKVGRR